MQIFNRLSLALLAVAVVAPLGLRADEDTDVQAAARAAIQQKMRETTGQ